jgi:hypothetical protein
MTDKEMIWQFTDVMAVNAILITTSSLVRKTPIMAVLCFALNAMMMQRIRFWRKAVN